MNSLNLSLWYSSVTRMSCDMQVSVFDLTGYIFVTVDIWIKFIFQIVDVCLRAHCWSNLVRYVWIGACVNVCFDMSRGFLFLSYGVTRLRSDWSIKDYYWIIIMQVILTPCTIKTKIPPNLVPKDSTLTALDILNVQSFADCHWFSFNYFTKSWIPG